MKIIEWSDEYLINVRQLDKQHEKLFAMINTLGELTNKGEDFSYILKNLITYADVHFATEEKYLEKFNYPNTDFHKNEHLFFREKINNFNEIYLNGESDISGEIINFLKTWLENHMQVEDKRFGPFLNEKGLY